MGECVWATGGQRHRYLSGFLPNLRRCPAGLLATLYVVVERLFLDVSLVSRPALLLGSLLIVLGIQILAIDLVGKIVIFTHARDLKECTVEKVIN